MTATTTSTQSTASGAVPFLAGFGVLYTVLAGLAELDATGRHGVVILAAVLLVASLVERLLSRAGGAVAVRSWAGPSRASAACSCGSAWPPCSRRSTRWSPPSPAKRFILKPGWPWLLVGTFAFHGLAEELVWRGYAFRRLRRGRSFRAAVLLTMPLVAATHLPVISDVRVHRGHRGDAGGSGHLAAAGPSVRAGRHTLWAPAIVHAGIDSFKLVSIPDDARLSFSLTLAAISLSIPLLALAARRTPSTPDNRNRGRP